MRNLLLNAAVGAMSVGILESKTHFGTIFFQVEKLLAVKCSTPLLSNELNSILILHPTLNQGQGNQHWGSSKACHTMHGNAASWLLPELNPKKIQPIINNLVGGRSSIIKGPIQNLNALLDNQVCIIRGLAHSNNRCHPIFLQFLDEFVKRGISGIVGNEESHVFVSDLHWGRSIHTSHF